MLLWDAWAGWIVHPMHLQHARAGKKCACSVLAIGGPSIDWRMTGTNCLLLLPPASPGQGGPTGDDSGCRTFTSPPSSIVDPRPASLSVRFLPTPRLLPSWHRRPQAASNLPTSIAMTSGAAGQSSLPNMTRPPACVKMPVADRASSHTVSGSVGVVVVS